MWIDTALICVWVGGVLLSWRLFRDIFTPLCVYVSVWCGCLLLFRLRLIAYDHLEPRTWFLIAAGMASFIFGCMLAALRPVKRRDGPHRRVANLAAFRRAIVVLLVLATVGTVLFAVRMASVYGFETYFTNPSIIRADSRSWTSMGPLGALFLLAYPLLACSVIHILGTGRVTWLTAAGIVVPVLQTYLLTDRLTLVAFAVCSFFICVYHSGRRVLDRKLALLLLAGVACALVYFVAVGSLYSKLIGVDSPAAVYTSFVPRPGLELSLLTPYAYVTGSFPTFQAAINDVQGWSWGEQSLYPLARVLYKLRILGRDPDATSFAFYRVPIPFNTYTWLIAFYSDFGLYGVLLLPGLFGWAETRLYVRMKRAPSLFSLAGTSAVVTATVLSFYAFLQFDFMLWYFLLVMLLVSAAAHLKPRAEPAMRPTRGAARDVAWGSEIVGVRRGFGLPPQAVRRW